jgi:L-threonylcarbamoyladenylate synthase
VTVPVLAGLGSDGAPLPEVAHLVARAWLAGGLVGLPTETVYGLAADAQDAAAVARIYAAKGRPADHPLIVHVEGSHALDGWSARHNEAAVRLAEAFWPGPLTVIVARGPRAGDFITGGQGTVALRCPAHAVALACLRALVEVSGDPARGVAAPSANRFGRVSPTRATDVVAELGGALDPARDLVVDGGPCDVGVESTIVDCTAEPPRVLRLGAISQAQIDAVLAAQGSRGAGADGAGNRAADGAGAFDDVRPGGTPTSVPRADEVRAPGTLESHYAPHARVVLVEAEGVSRDPGLTGAAVRGGPGAHPVGLIAHSAVATPEGWVRLCQPGSAEEYARVLYAALRAADVRGVEVVVAVLPDPADGPLALAVRDRLARAAHRD